MVDPKRILPHREPFLLVDEVVAQTGDTFECRKHVRNNEDWVPGHFPNEPVMPGVLMVEAMAQAAAIGLHLRERWQGESRGYLAGVDRARFRRKVVPGDTLRLTGTITRFRRGLCQVDAVAWVGDEIAAEATLSFMVAGNAP
jgi:3-hydroxyacyl-[acyl-carrier-protein] dehydratase